MQQALELTHAWFPPSLSCESCGIGGAFGFGCQACDAKTGCTKCPPRNPYDWYDQYYVTTDAKGRKMCNSCRDDFGACKTCTKNGCTACFSQAYATTNSWGQLTCMSCENFGQPCDACAKDGCTKCRSNGYMSTDAHGRKVCPQRTDFGEYCATCSAKQGCLTSPKTALALALPRMIGEHQQHQHAQPARAPSWVGLQQPAVLPVAAATWTS